MTKRSTDTVWTQIKANPALYIFGALLAVASLLGDAWRAVRGKR